MKFSSFILAPLAALTQVCTANFDIYRTEDTGVVGGSSYAWAISAAEPSCNEVRNQRTWYSTSNVSGNRLGINCVGSCAFEDNVSGISRFEMHFSNNPLFHWTLYRDRGHPYKMYGLDGKVYGECIMFPGHSYVCPSLGTLSGRRKFRCLTQFTAAQIIAGR
ncbi:hypothetical protein B0T11DRAFT_300447 [Plectosphaerella cucumerina]|uniref:Uncharacterized protein n=1 Tax=Plectosphaerella cucumerina TaxID=40658 RepID=A0A8K0WZA9_9PEZI|nr:hypothetical protein B0T11DRAFT_300447 [Plectosphaerella cucumerina]